MTKATVSTKGQIVIPKAVRDRLNLKAGTELVFDVQGEAVVLKRAVRDFPDWRTMRGMARGGPSLTKALIEERAAEKAHDDARVKGH
jgi:AbrB family looped-hinge helix DNA binding protein